MRAPEPWRTRSVTPTTLAARQPRSNAAATPRPSDVIFVPGGVTDTSARVVAESLGRRLGQQVIVDNKPGASGNIAMAEAARADDQHTLILGHIGTLAVNPYMYDKLPYDPNKDFKPVSLLAKVPSLYVVNANLPVKNLKEFIALVKSRPGTMNYGSAGNGSAGHLAMEYLKMTANIFITHIPYKGTGPQLTDLLAGRLDAAAVGASAILQHIKSGKLRCIATGSTRRLPQLPDVPTVAEQGFPGMSVTGSIGLLAPAGTPVGIVEQIAQASRTVVAEPAFRQMLIDAGIEPTLDSNPEKFRRSLAADVALWTAIVNGLGLKID